MAVLLIVMWSREVIVRRSRELLYYFYWLKRNDLSRGVDLAPAHVAT